MPAAEGPCRTPDGEAWFVPLLGDDTEGFWLEVALVPVQDRQSLVQWLLPVVSALIGRSREAVRLHEELAERSAEIDLLYVVGEILGQTVRLEEAAKTILRELCDALNARRGSLMVFEESEAALRLVAGRGMNVPDIQPLAVTVEQSVAARVFRSGRTLAWDP
ncbi:MAG TPA: hypothetical protein VFS07_07385, partial [Gemmatimonadales bacterium]|nr:hypothetical protein [Gemmatimonadales bacterium]